MSPRKQLVRAWLAAHGDRLPSRPRRGRKRHRGAKALHVVAEEFRALEPHEQPATTPLRVSIVRRWLHRKPSGDL